MSMDYNRLYHPTRQELFAHAENLVDGRAPISAHLVGHLAACPRCKAEFAGIRRSLDFAAAAPDLAPATDLTAQILLQAKKERKRQHKVARRYSTARVALRGFAYAAMLALIVGVMFNMTLNEPRSAASNSQGTTQTTASTSRPSFEAITFSANTATPESLRAAADQLHALLEAVEYGPPGATPTAQELEQLRAIRQLSAEMEAALEALERNPGSTRAKSLVEANLEQQSTLLRRLYVERTL